MPKNVDVKNGQLIVSDREHVDLIGHVFRRDSDRELLKDLWTRIGNAERQGA